MSMLRTLNQICILIMSSYTTNTQYLLLFPSSDHIPRFGRDYAVISRPTAGKFRVLHSHHSLVGDMLSYYGDSPSSNYPANAILCHCEIFPPVRTIPVNQDEVVVKFIKKMNPNDLPNFSPRCMSNCQEKTYITNTHTCSVYM